MFVSPTKQNKSAADFFGIITSSFWEQFDNNNFSFFTEKG